MGPTKKRPKTSRLRDEEQPAVDRFTRVWVKGLRSLRNVELPLHGLTVLIGENGSGKSSLIEAIQILREASSTSFNQTFNEIHGGTAALLRKGERFLTIGAEIEGSQAPCTYEFTMEDQGYGLSFAKEEVRVLPRHHRPSSGDLKLQRDDSSVSYFDMPAASQKTIQSIDRSVPMLPRLGSNPLQLDLFRMVTALQMLDVQVAFEVTARWVSRATSRQSATRESVTVQPTESLHLLGRNLPNAFHELKNHVSVPWSETLDLIRLGLGEDVVDVLVRSEVAGGQITLAVRYRSLTDPVPMFWLSDGVLAYLAFVALVQLSPPGGLLAFDEPEVHLHPSLIDRVVGFFETLSRRRPVLVATQSDRFLDALSDPASSVVLCELDESRATRLIRPDGDALRDWLKDYRGLGEIRAAGHERSILLR